MGARGPPPLPEFLMTLLHNQIFLLLVIIILGELLGKIRLWNLSLGPSAIIFVALAFGHFGVTLPQGVQTIGLAMFIYAVGLQAGPGFASSFRSHGLAMALTVIVMAVTGILVSYALLPDSSASMRGPVPGFSPGP